MAIDRQTLGGLSLFAAGLFFLREAIIWLFGRALDALAVGFHLATLSWSNVAATLLMATGVTLVFWPRRASKAIASSEAVPTYSHLIGPATNVVRRIRAQRSARYFSRDRLEPLNDVIQTGLAVLISFEKAGFAIPDLDFEHSEQMAIGLDAFLSPVIQLLNLGHIDEAKALSPELSSSSMDTGRQFNTQLWFQSL